MNIKSEPIEISFYVNMSIGDKYMNRLKEIFNTNAPFVSIPLKDISEDFLRLITPAEYKEPTFDIEFYGQQKILVQKHKNKKKRINKKWAKKYGYKEALMPLNIKMSKCDIQESQDENIFTINSKLDN